MKIFIIIWTVIFLLPILYYVFQDPHTKGISITDLKNCLIIYIIGITILLAFRKCLNIIRR